MSLKSRRAINMNVARMDFARAVLVGAACCALVVSAPALAKRPPCRADEMAIADVRAGGGKLCLKKSEWAKARRICARQGSKNPMDCICQDADSVGACGD
jgi:hypothetical protein